jgi:serine/threonine protein kinase
MDAFEGPGNTLSWETQPVPATGLDLARRLLDAARSGNPDLAPLAGFEVARPLGRGGMGSVFLLRRPDDETLVALKVMSDRLAADSDSRNRFLREVEVTGGLVHPNIVRLLHSGCHEGVIFYTSEFCDAGTLAQLCRSRGGSLPVGEAVPLIRQVLDGLEYAHRAPVRTTLPDRQVEAFGLVHRDLKPSNVFLHAAGGSLVARIGDFGLAKAFDLSGLSGYSRTGVTAGTPAFMPRQQVLNYKYVMPEVDVWAMAACLYYTLAGTPPRDFPPDRDKWGVVLRDRPVPIRDRDPARSIPVPLAQLIDAAVADDPAIQFRTIAELRHALDTSLA